MVSLVISSRFMDEGLGFGWPFMWRGVPGNGDLIWAYDRGV